MKRAFPFELALPRALALVPALALALGVLPCCDKEQPAAQKGAAAPRDLAGEWHSDIQGPDRLISKSIYRIEQRGDTVAIRLVSTKSPAETELVPDGMWMLAAGTWQSNALRLDVTSWISGKDTCTFQMRGDMDKAGECLLLHFPGDVCGETSLPYTRKLCRPE